MCVWIEVSKKKNHKSYSLHGGSILSTDPGDFEFHLFEASHGNSIAPGGKEQQFALKFLVEIVNYFPEISRKEQGKKRLEWIILMFSFRENEKRQFIRRQKTSDSHFKICNTESAKHWDLAYNFPRKPVPQNFSFSFNSSIFLPRNSQFWRPWFAIISSNFKSNQELLFIFLLDLNLREHLLDFSIRTILGL